MTEILESCVEGKVKRYNDDDGWGFIEREGEPDVFFHASALVCSPPYKGEKVVFDVIRSTSPKHDREAQAVRRAGVSRTTGDVIEWHVEPGSWDARGEIAPLDGTALLPFSIRDLRTPISGGGPKPRPWHGATFAVAELVNGQQAVDVEIDTRYPLQRFAYLGREEEMVKDLKGKALDEDWDYRNTASNKESPILYNYLQFTFAKLRDEDRGLPPDQRKIRVLPDLTTPLAAFNTGLVDEKYKSIYALFEANEAGRTQRWRYRAFCVAGEGHGKVLARYFNPLPKPAAYFHSTSELLYDPDLPLHPDYSHILTHNRDRLPQEILDQIHGLDESKAIRRLTSDLDAAIEVAKKRAQWNYKTAIPHYFPSFKRIELLLPLCLVEDNRVDVALSVQRLETAYLANTILRLDWAYKSARLVCRPDSDWLAPKKIEQGPESLDLGDIE